METPEVPTAENLCGCCGNMYGKRKTKSKVYQSLNCWRRRDLAKMEYPSSESGSSGTKALQFLATNFPGVEFTPGKKVWVCESCENALRAAQKKVVQFAEKASPLTYIGAKLSKRKLNFPEEPSTSKAARQAEIVVTHEELPVTREAPPAPLALPAPTAPTAIPSVRLHRLPTLRQASARPDWRKRLVSLANSSKWAPMLLLLDKRPSGRRALDNYCFKRAQTEMRRFTKKGRGSELLRSPLSLAAIRQLTYPAVVEAARETMPLLTTAIDGAMSASRGEKRSNVDSVHGSVIAQLAYYVNRNLKLMHQCNGVMVRICGCNKKALTHLNHMGLCQSFPATSSAIDTLRQEIDTLRQEHLDKINDWKETIETSIGTGTLSSTS